MCKIQKILNSLGLYQALFNLWGA